MQSHPLFFANYSLSFQLQCSKQVAYLSSRTASAKQGWGHGGHSHAHLGPNCERTCCWQSTGQAQCPRLCKPHGIFNKSPVTQCERGLKVPSEPCSLGLSLLLCRERPFHIAAGKQEVHSSTCVSSFRKHLVTGPLPRLAHPWLGPVCT